MQRWSRFDGRRMDTKMAPSQTDPNEALIQFLDRYCSTEIAPGYAVMLRGPWGSGKTWFVEKYRERLKAMEKRSLYVTLFGVKRPADISDQFFAQVHTVLGNEKVQKGWSIAKSLLKGALKVDLDGDGKEDGSLQISIPDLGKWASTEGAVLIFDDLERVGMPLDDILGYINQFVEHDGYRVIVIANETKAVEMTPGFPTIKEKVIGRTFEIQPNVVAALENFLGEISENEAHTILKERREDILKVFRRADYGNLRQLRQAIFDFSDIWNCFQTNDLSGRKEFIDRLVEDVLTLSIEHRAGTISVADVRNLGVQNWSKFFNDHDKKEEETPLTTVEQALKRHGFDYQPVLALLSETYAAFFWQGHLLKEAAKEALLRSPYLANESTPSWRRLWYLTALTDSEFKILSADVFKKFVSLQYSAEGEVLHAVGLMLNLASQGLMGKTTIQVQKTAKKVVLQLAKKKKLDAGPSGGYSDFSSVDMGAYGLGYTGRESEPFREFVAFYRENQHEERKKKVRRQSKEWLAILATDSEAWAKHLERIPNEESWFSDEPVFDSMSANQFCDQLVQLPTPSLINVQRAFKGRYEHISEYSKWKLDERPFLEKVLAILQKSLSVKKRGALSLSNYALKTWFVPSLRQAISVLERFELNQKNAP